MYITDAQRQAFAGAFTLARASFFDLSRLLLLFGPNESEKSLSLLSFGAGTQWGRTAKNWDVENGPLTRPFAHSLAPLAHSLALHCSFPTAYLFAHSLAHSIARG